jgi:hypothetical protein
VSWSLRFAEPIVLEDGSKLATLRDAIRHLGQTDGPILDQDGSIIPVPSSSRNTPRQAM